MTGFPLPAAVRRMLQNSTLLRFLLVGGTISLVYSALTALATALIPWPKSLLAALVWLCCIPPAFWCQRRFTFHDARPHRHALLLYAATQGLGMGIAALAGALFSRREFWPDLLVFLCASAVAAILSYLINRLVIFRADAPRA